MFSGYVDIDDETRLFYEVHGSTQEVNCQIDQKQPTLIFLHGGPGVVDHSLYVSFWSRFAMPGYTEQPIQVIFYDHRANGRSYKETINGDKDYGDIAKWNLAQWGGRRNKFLQKIKYISSDFSGCFIWRCCGYVCCYPVPQFFSGAYLV